MRLQAAGSAAAAAELKDIRTNTALRTTHKLSLLRELCCHASARLADSHHVSVTQLVTLSSSVGSPTFSPSCGILSPTDPSPYVMHNLTEYLTSATPHRRMRPTTQSTSSPVCAQPHFHLHIPTSIQSSNVMRCEVAIVHSLPISCFRAMPERHSTSAHRWQLSIAHPLTDSPSGDCGGVARAEVHHRTQIRSLSSSHLICSRSHCRNTACTQRRCTA